MRIREAKPSRRVDLSSISARLNNRVRLEAHSNGTIVALCDGYSIALGAFGAATADRIQELRTGLPLGPLALGGRDKDIDLLVRRLASQRLLEYRIGCPQDSAEDLIIIEPQAPDYWPRTPPLGDADALALSRFAYIRCRDRAMVLESPRAGALFKICSPKLASFLAMLSIPRKIGQLRQEDDFPGIEVLAFLVDCQVLFKIDFPGASNLRAVEGDDNLVFWDFHDFLFHTRSTEGRHTNPLGGVYPHSEVISSLPAVRPAWPGKKINLSTFLPVRPDAMSPLAKLFRERHSTRDFDDRHPITLAELSQFLDGTARVLSETNGGAAEFGGDGSIETIRPYPSAGASYELELYLAVNICEGLAHGFYHYDSAAHELAPIEVPTDEVKELLMRAAYAMDALAAPQILITIAARFGRVSWKYSSIAYSLILKDVGILTQTLYLMATEMGLGGCAIGIVNIDQFSKMTGIGCHVEGPVGQFVIGRGYAE